MRRGDSIPLELDDGVKDFPLYVCVPEDEVENVIKVLRTICRMLIGPNHQKSFRGTCTTQSAALG